MAATMHAKDTISASQAECYITIEGNRYNFMQAISLEAKIEKTKKGLEIIAKKLSNEAFTAKAPEAVVNAEREKEAKLRALLAQLEQSAQALEV